MGSPFLNAPLHLSAHMASPVARFLMYARRTSDRHEAPTARDTVYSGSPAMALDVPSTGSMTRTSSPPLST